MASLRSGRPPRQAEVAVVGASGVSPTSDAPDVPGNVDAAVDAPRLTARQLEALRMVSMGWETSRIASELNISPHTVLNHIRHFRRKLNAPTKLIAVITAIRLGILPLGQ